MSLKGKSLEKYVFDQYGIELKEILFVWYWSDGLSQQDIAERLKVSKGSVCNAFKKYSIPKRKHNYWIKGIERSKETKKKLSQINKGRVFSEETKKKMSEARKGFRLAGNYDKFPGKRNRSDGYIQVYIPEHPFSNSEGYVMEHRIVMEQKIGRLLKPEEEVHHINHKRNDNRPENLHLFASKKDHMKFHMHERYGKEEELKYEYQ